MKRAARKVRRPRRKPLPEVDEGQIAAYQVAPVSAITHVAPVKNIELWKDTSKYVLNFAEPAKAIGPLKLIPKPNGIVKAPQAPRYTTYDRLVKATSLNEAF